MLAATPALARTLTPEEAMARAAADAPTKMRAFSNAFPALTMTGKYDTLTTYYIYSTDNSAMILGADDLSLPVLAYLDTPIAADTQLPPQMTWWLEQYGKQIAYAEQHRDEITFTDSPCRVAEGRSTIEPMLQTTWNQAAPFNDLLPDGVVTGCVATAMAQVMKYHNYPEKGTGTVSTLYNGGTISMDLDQTTFDWANMLNNYPKDNLGTTEQRNAVATLMKACGYSVKTEYSTSGSGANDRFPPFALRDNFKYDKSIDRMLREYCSDEEWDSIIYASLQNGCPVLYAGSGNGGGHEFVCDGYRTDGYYHFNWGWGGTSDGYFALSALTPEVQGIGGNFNGFNIGQTAVTNICPPREGSTLPEAWMVAAGDLEYEMEGTYILVTSTLGETDGYFVNHSLNTATFDIGVLLTDIDGNKTPIAAREGQEVPFGSGLYYIQLNMPETTPSGSYTMAPAYNITGTDNWKPMRTINGIDQSIRVHVTGNSIYKDGSKCTTFSNPVMKTELRPGQPFEMSIDLKRTGIETVLDKYYAVMLDSDNYIMADIDWATTILDNDNTVTVQMHNGYVNDYVKPGEYTMAILNWWKDELYTWTVTVTGETPAPDTVIKDAVVSSETIVQGQDFEVTATAKNSGNATDTSVATVKLVDKSYRPYEVGSLTLNLPADGVEHTLLFNCNAPATLPTGDYYLLVAYGEYMSSNLVSVTVVTDESGITEITADENARYYDLQGREISRDNLAPGIYIVRAGDRTAKVRL